jgi:hypothetical protein
MTKDELTAVFVLSTDFSAIAAGTPRYFMQDIAACSMRRPWKDLSPRQSAFLWQLVYRYRALPYMPPALVEVARQKRFGTSKQALPLACRPNK